jgi:hypothetical protein
MYVAALSKPHPNLMPEVLRAQAALRHEPEELQRKQPSLSRYV